MRGMGGTEGWEEIGHSSAHHPMQLSYRLLTQIATAHHHSGLTVANFGSSDGIPTLSLAFMSDQDDDWASFVSALVAPPPVQAQAEDFALCAAATSSRKQYSLPHWSRRTVAEQHLAACRMRLAKTERSKKRLHRETITQVTKALDDISGSKPVSSSLVLWQRKGQAGLLFVSRKTKRAGGD